MPYVRRTMGFSMHPFRPATKVKSQLSQKSPLSEKIPIIRNIAIITLQDFPRLPSLVLRCLNIVGFVLKIYFYVAELHSTLSTSYPVNSFKRADTDDWDDYVVV